MQTHWVRCYRINNYQFSKKQTHIQFYLDNCVSFQSKLDKLPYNMNYTNSMRCHERNLSKTITFTFAANLRPDNKHSFFKIVMQANSMKCMYYPGDKLQGCLCVLHFVHLYPSSC